MTNKTLTTLVALGGLLLTGHAYAADHSNFSATATLTTDYVFRGVSYSNQKPAVQASIDYANPKGFYAGIWSSSWDGSAYDSYVEQDFYAGVARSLDNGLGYDVSALYYTYPGHTDKLPTPNYGEIHGALNYQFKHVTLQPTVEIGANYSPNYSGEDGIGKYGYVSVGLQLPDGFGLSGKYGHQSVEGKHSVPGGYSYHHYTASLTKSVGGFDFDLSYHKASTGCYAVYGKNLCRGRVVFSVSRTM